MVDPSDYLTKWAAFKNDGRVFAPKPDDMGNESSERLPLAEGYREYRTVESAFGEITKKTGARPATLEGYCLHLFWKGEDGPYPIDPSERRVVLAMGHKPESLLVRSLNKLMELIIEKSCEGA